MKFKILSIVLAAFILLSTACSSIKHYDDNYNRLYNQYDLESGALIAFMFGISIYGMIDYILE